MIFDSQIQIETYSLTFRAVPLIRGARTSIHLGGQPDSGTHKTTSHHRHTVPGSGAKAWITPVAQSMIPPVNSLLHRTPQLTPPCTSTFHSYLSASLLPAWCAVSLARRIPAALLVNCSTVRAGVRLATRAGDRCAVNQSSSGQGVRRHAAPENGHSRLLI
jgi:hypothetical protein